MRIKISELRRIIREELESSLFEFDTSDMAPGTAWKVSGKGWAAKNKNGVTDYWYGKDMNKNKESADKFRNDSTRKPTKQ